MKRILFKIAFLYPRLYAFFCYYRKRDQREAFEDKVRMFCSSRTNGQELKKIVRGLFEIRGTRKLQNYLIPQMDRDFVKWFVAIEGIDRLDQALKQGRGVLLMSAHIGNPHMGFSVLRILGYQINIIKGGKPRRSRQQRFRYSDPHEFTIFTHDTSLPVTSRERALEILQSGKILYYSGDAVGGKTKVEIPFLGHRIRFSTGTLHLAFQANAIVIPFIHLYQGGKIRLIFHEPMEGPWTGERDYRRVIESYAKLLESHVLERPEEYMGFYGNTILSDYYQSHGKQGDRGAEGEE